MNSTDNNLFSFISSYIPRENRNPREDYLTQIFTWMLKNVDGLDNSYMEFLCKKCGLVYESLEVTVESQKTVSNGRIDLIVMNSKVGFICEHKIGAGLSEDQIEKYMDCSKNDLGEGREYHSVLITQYYSQHTQDANIMLIWNDIYKDFIEPIKEKYRNDEKNKFIVEQFLDFLERNGLRSQEFESMSLGKVIAEINPKKYYDYNGGDNMNNGANVWNAFLVLSKTYDNIRMLREKCKGLIEENGYELLGMYDEVKDVHLKNDTTVINNNIPADYWIAFQKNDSIFAIEFLLFDETKNTPIYRVIKYSYGNKKPIPKLSTRTECEKLYCLFDENDSPKPFEFSKDDKYYKIFSSSRANDNFFNAIYIEGDLMALEKGNLQELIIDNVDRLNRVTI